MWTIRKEFHFSASHQLDHLPKGHPCGRLHGHNYIVVVELKGSELNKDGFIQDYGELKPIKEYIDNNLDHKHLNDFFILAPTAEWMAKWLYDYFKKEYPALYAIELSETPKTNARYEGTGDF